MPPGTTKTAPMTAYAQDGEASAWQGKGAESLGLNGPVDSSAPRIAFGEVQLGVAITRDGTRKDSKSRLGIDLTFSAPKSVSLQAWSVAMRRSSRPTIAPWRVRSRSRKERAQARKKVDGRSQVETTGNLVVAKFRHETSREQDPQLHTHAVVMNLTQRADGQWRALKNDEIVKMNKYLGAVIPRRVGFRPAAAGVQTSGTIVMACLSWLISTVSSSKALASAARRSSAAVAAGLDRDTASRRARSSGPRCKVGRGRCR